MYIGNKKQNQFCPFFFTIAMWVNLKLHCQLFLDSFDLRHQFLLVFPPSWSILTKLSSIINTLHKSLMLGCPSLHISFRGKKSQRPTQPHNNTSKASHSGLFRQWAFDAVGYCLFILQLTSNKHQQKQKHCAKFITEDFRVVRKLPIRFINWPCLIEGQLLFLFWKVCLFVLESCWPCQ